MMKLQDARTISPKQLYERRKQAIALFKKGMTRIEIGKIVGVRRDVVGQWISKWKEGGLRSLKVSDPGKPKGSGLTLNQDQQKKIQRCLVEKTPDQLKMNFALWTRHAVQQFIKKEIGIEMPIRTIGDYLKRWGFTPQKPIKRAYERNEKKVKAWLKKEYPAIESRAQKEKAEIHWGDETGISNRDQVGRGYAPKGKTPIRKHAGKRERINMISTVTKLGKIRFMFYEKRMNSGMLIKFMKRLVKGATKKIFLILDNLPTHHSKPVKKWVAENIDEIELFYLPSYSPDLNPDEYLNRDLKAQLSKRPSKREKGEFTALAKTEMRSLQKSPERVKKYFNSDQAKYAA